MLSSRKVSGTGFLLVLFSSDTAMMLADDDYKAAKVDAKAKMQISEDKVANAGEVAGKRFHDVDDVRIPHRCSEVVL